MQASFLVTPPNSDTDLNVGNKKNGGFLSNTEKLRVMGTKRGKGKREKKKSERSGRMKSSVGYLD